MKGFKQWLLTFMAAFMLVGVMTGCNNDKNTEDETKTEETENSEETNTEKSGE
ncbi:hypothetical protein H1Z61_16255 [Bacillus aquiflavi]|uniref:Lipoprotein n=1 Tax=Bacillus aquiflavi TaxID=2672567 RepID=A0A7W2AFD1_9BACI|nr:hypothetical protein [Bacillus aquiflavi]MBA4538635.1 hypothetical protein [Bacillus aquiflavi]UAC47884.1 hypothetical protein K6959_14950 [Bacillus aquiflavi]